MIGQVQNGRRKGRVPGGWRMAWVGVCLFVQGVAGGETAAHPAFQSFKGSVVPPVVATERARRPIDAFVAERLTASGLGLSPAASRPALLRRASFLVTGLPPSPEEIAAFEADASDDAWERVVDRLLASPRHGERWAKWWLDAVGYADSNGYFNADTDRPLAYRYRDYVIRSLNSNKPFDRFVREQLAGDELCGWTPGEPVTPAIVELLEATHFLRNGQDGSGESDGNPDEVRVDRYYALESAVQIFGTAFLGMTVQCAKCHDHKFEPLTQREYYGLQAFLYPAFDIGRWTKPNDRVVRAALPGEREAWKQREAELDAELAGARSELNGWIAANRPKGRELFRDPFEGAGRLTGRWSATAPGDDGPGGKPPVGVDSENAPGAFVRDGRLHLVEGGGGGDRWLCTTQAFDWRPAQAGAWIQVTFDLVADRLKDMGPHAERIGFFIAAHDFDDNGKVSGGNILIDGNPGGASAVDIDYPGTDTKHAGKIGDTGYRPGRNYGVRVTRRDDGRFDLEHLVDGMAEGPGMVLDASDLPPGGFGFEYCCGRSFVVDNVVVEAADVASPAWTATHAAYRKDLATRREVFDRVVSTVQSRRTAEPGRIAWTTDAGPDASPVPLLKRGNPKTPGEAVPPLVPAFLGGSGVPEIRPTARTTGRRRALAEWLLEAGSAPSALLARVTVNRVWQHYFGTGLVSTPDNLGRSGATPSHPELLEHLAARFAAGWDLRAVHREILLSAVFQQSSAPRPDGLRIDPSNRLLWRFPLLRLDAESIRDAMLFTSGRLGAKAAGPYVPTPRAADGEVGPDEASPEGWSRSIFLQSRRTQVPTLLGVFDAPSIVFTCTRRAATTMPLQSLAQLNSGFVVRRGADLALRLRRECGDDGARLDRAFLGVLGRKPDPGERSAAELFLEEQKRHRGEEGAWADFCQSLYALNAFLYLE